MISSTLKWCAVLTILSSITLAVLLSISDQSQFFPGASFAPFLAGNNSCYMIQALYPKNKLNDILPHNFIIPNNSIMRAYYPDTVLQTSMHPFLMSFCHGSNIGVIGGKGKTPQMPVPAQEEIMFIFPVIYTADNNVSHLCSYVPVLYLNSSLGVIGGLYYGLRKEYHSHLRTQVSINPDGKSWLIENIIKASFTQLQIESDEKEILMLPQFIQQTFTNPFITISYPPFYTVTLYQAKIYPIIVKRSTESFSWNYKGVTVEANGSSSIFAKYWFTLTVSMNPTQYFAE